MRRYQEVRGPGGTRRYGEEVPGGTRRYGGQEVPGGTRRYQEVPGGPGAVCKLLLLKNVLHLFRI